MRMPRTEELTRELLEWEQDRNRRRLGILSGQVLRRQNRLFAGSAGISQGNHRLGFVPAFRDDCDGRCEISRFADGRPAPVHLLEGLPAAWIGRRDPAGQALATRPGIVAGFLRGGRFYTREQAAQAVSH
jgi:hypothetical protein